MGIAPAFPLLAAPGRIGGLSLANRMCMGPIGGRYADDNGYVTGRQIDFYAERARGGVGLVIVEATYIHPYLGRMLISDDCFIPGLARLVAAIHEGGAKASIEIQTRRGRSDASEPLGASAIAHPHTGRMPREVTASDIAHIVADFGRAAQRAQLAGFDCIEIHGGSGYLLNEFLSPLANRRTDSYGGSVANRARFALEIVAGVRRMAGASFPMIYRMGASERVEGGIALEDAVEFARLLEGAGVDAIEVVSGSTVQSPEWIVMPLGLPEEGNIPLAAAIKKAVSIPILTGGNLDDPARAERLLFEGGADFITLGKALIADPEYPRKIGEGRLADVRPCIRCLHCTDPRLRDNVGIRCFVNPRVGREQGFPIRPAKARKRIAVVGGGLAGMQAALVLAARGHTVELFEREQRLGGDLRRDTLPPYAEHSAKLLAYFERQLTQHGVVVHTGIAITADSRELAQAQAIMIATGGTPLVPRLSGLETTQVVTFRDVLDGTCDLGAEVIVLGSDLAACKAAEFARNAGRTVTMLERGPVFAEAVEETIRRVTLARLRAKGIAMQAGVEVVAIDRDTVTCAGGATQRRADTLVCAVGLAPELGLYLALITRGRAAYAVGDCVRPGTLDGPIQQAFEAAFAIF